MGTALHPVPFACSCWGNPFPLRSSSLGSLQNGVPRGCWAAAPSPPASVASSLFQELGQILLSCPCALSHWSDAGMSRRKGRQGKQEGQRCLLAPGTATEAQPPLLPSFPCTSLCIYHQWKFPLVLPVPGLVSSFPGTVVQPGAGGCCCSR